MKKSGLISIFLIIFLMMSLSNALTVKSEKEKEKIDSRIMDSGSASAAKTSAPSVTLSEGLGGRETIHYETSPGDPIQIQKVVLPGNKKKYTKDDMLKICIEIKSNMEIDGLNIHEFVSDGYSIANVSSCYKIFNLRDLDRYRDSVYISTNSFSGESDDIIVNKHSGPNKIAWKCLCENNSTKIDDGKKFLSGILGTEINSLKLLKKDENSAVFKIDGLNCTIDAFECNGTAILTYGRSSHQLYLSREPNQKMELDNRTGRVIDKSYSGNITISNLDNSFDIYVPSLKPKERLVYSYYLKPKNQAKINTITTIRVYNNEFDYPDIDYPLDIEVSKPEFEVTASNDKYDLLDIDKLKIIYSIYSEDLVENGNITLKVRLDDSLGNYEIHDPDNQDQKISNSEKDINLSEGKGNITYLIEFPNSGSYSIPAIKVNDKLYSFEKEIIVETKRDKYSNWISIFFGFVFLLLGEIFGKDVQEFIIKNRASGESILKILIINIFSRISNLFKEIYDFIITIFSRKKSTNKEAINVDSINKESIVPDLVLLIIILIIIIVAYISLNI